MRSDLGETLFARALEEGKRMPPEQVVEEILCRETFGSADLAIPGGRVAGDHLGDLSPRECEVAGLVARGLTNHAIAESPGISERTTAVHVHHILKKLSVYIP